MGWSAPKLWARRGEQLLGRRRIPSPSLASPVAMAPLAGIGGDLGCLGLWPGYLTAITPLPLREAGPGRASRWAEHGKPLCWPALVLARPRVAGKCPAAWSHQQCWPASPWLS